jgi:NADH-quinone oxidoreductase subunit N
MKEMLLFAPEWCLLIGSLILFVLTLQKTSAKFVVYVAAGITISALLCSLATFESSGELFFKAFKIDYYSQIFKAVILSGVLAVLLLGRGLKGIDSEIVPEYYLFLMLSSFGLVMMVSSVEMLSFFIALELSSYSLYILVPLRDDRQGLRTQMESAVKYILFGVMATGIMLFGMSYLFGFAHTTYLSELVPILHAHSNEPVVLAGIAMVMAGFFFKLAVFPFHFWVPDVYQGASNETTAFIASVPKVGAVALLIRIASLVSPQGEMVITLLGILAVCSMFYGNLSALHQKDLKRMLGFSGIAHAGYVLLGILTLNEYGFSIAMFYIIGYLAMTLATFLVICQVSKDGENLMIEDLSGLYQRSPFLAFTLGLSMFAMAGIPPMAGFMGKFMLLTGALQEEHLILVILAAINTAIAIYYYLSVVRVTYCKAPEDRPVIEIDFITKTVSMLLIITILTMGILPSLVLKVTERAVGTIL